MMLLEPYNIYINMDLSNDMQPLQPYRLCDIFECPVLNEIGKLSLIGMYFPIGHIMLNQYSNMTLTFSPLSV